jgi:hypothetical protein
MVPHRRGIAALLVVGALAVCRCASAPPRLPYGGVDTMQIPGSDKLREAWVDSQRQCHSPIFKGGARALVRGTLERRRIDTSFWIGMDGTRLRLEPPDTATPRFGLLASYSYGSDRKDEATLVLPASGLVVRSRSRELVELVLGVPLSALDMQSVLTGCLINNGGSLQFERFDAGTMKMVAGNDPLVEVFMRRRSIGSPWAVFAIVTGVPGRPIRWRADPERSHGVLESVRLTSVEWNGTAGRLFDLTFSLDYVQTPAPAADMFTLSLPESATFVPIDAIRLNHSLPLLAD